MNWETLYKRLREIERHIATGERFIVRTRNKLKTAIRDGRDPVEGEQVLRTLEAVQALYLEERDRLKDALKRLVN